MYREGKQLNMTNAINGEVKCGDWVLSMPGNDYGCLVGKVIEITKFGTPEHAEDADNSTDNVHVNFCAFDYPPERIAEIGAAFSALYGQPMTFEDLPPDDVVMAPEMLVRITELGEDKILRLGSSRGECEAFCSRFKPSGPTSVAR